MKFKKLLPLVVFSLLSITAVAETSQVALDNIRDHFRDGFLKATDKPFFAVVCVGTNREHLPVREFSAFLPLHENDFKADASQAKNVIHFKGDTRIVFYPATTFNDLNESVFSYQEAHYDVYENHKKLESGSLRSGVLTSVGRRRNLADCRYGHTVADYTRSILELMPQKK